MNHKPWKSLTNVLSRTWKCVIPILSPVEQWRASAICHPCRGTSWTTNFYQQAPHYFHFTINASRALWPGVRQEEVAWQGPEVAHDHQEVHGQLPPADLEGRRGIGEPAWWKNSTIVSSLAERKIVTSTLDSSTPFLAFYKWGLWSPCW